MSFADLPDEVVAVILSQLNCEQILDSCSLSKRFINICKQHKTNIFKFGDIFKFGNLLNFNPVIMSKAIKTNKRFVNCGATIDNNYTFALIRSDGKVIILNKLKGINNVFLLNNANNIVSLYAVLNSKLYLLDSFGNIFCSEIREDIINNDEYNYIPTDAIKLNYSNIIQISYCNCRGAFFLDINGNVYNDNEIILRNIVKMFDDYNNDRSTIFLDIYGNIYGIGCNDFNKYHMELQLINTPILLPYKNVKDVFINYNTIMIVTNDNIITNLNSKNSFNLNTIKNIIKITRSDNDLCILNDKHILHMFDINSMNCVKQVTNVKNFIKRGDFIDILFNDGKWTSDCFYGNYREINVGNNADILDIEFITIGNKIYECSNNTTFIEICV